jgi:hypothetical protein
MNIVDGRLPKIKTEWVNSPLPLNTKTVKEKQALKEQKWQ